MSNISIYLRNHEAAAQAGRDLFRRASKAQRSQPWPGDLGSLASDVEDDLRSLRQIMGTLNVSPDLAAGIALRVGERVGRFKPNGRLLSRSPLSDLIEIEGLLSAVRAKEAGWRALRAAGVLPGRLEPLLEDLLRRAERQIERLLAMHRLAAEANL